MKHFSDICQIGGDATRLFPALKLPLKMSTFFASTHCNLFYDLQVVLYPTSNSPKSPDLHKMIVPKNSQDSDLKIKLAVRMDKPPHMKHCG